MTDRLVLRRDKLTLVIVKGDIAAERCDALVNAANNHLWMGSGVAGALKEAGGVEIEREAIARGPIEVGSAVETTAGRLDARWVIHAAVMGQDLETTTELIYRAARSALKLADELGAHSVALPALGTGVGGVPLEDAARSLREAITGTAPFESLAEIRLVLNGPRAFSAFSEVFDTGSQ